LIVLIDYAHLKATAKRSSGSMMQDLCPDAPMALRTARATKRDGPLACMGATSIRSQKRFQRRVQKKKTG